MANLCIIEKQMSIMDQGCWSMDSIQSELGIDWTNPWIAQHSFKEISIFNDHKLRVTTV